MGKFKWVEKADYDAMKKFEEDLQWGMNEFFRLTSPLRNKDIEDGKQE